MLMQQQQSTQNIYYNNISSNNNNNSSSKKSTFSNTNNSNSSGPSPPIPVDKLNEEALKQALRISILEANNNHANIINRSQSRGVSKIIIIIIIVYITNVLYSKLYIYIFATYC
jgi:hypothetical protein